MEELENLHEIQRDILVKLLFRKEARFSELKEKEIESDQFNFHLKRLLELELVRKNKAKTYELTTKGKEYANRMDEEIVMLEKQPKVTVMVIGVKGDKNNRKILVQKRLKHPFFGYIGFVSGKVKFGETLYKAAKREFLEETQLNGDFELLGVEHKIDYQSDKLVDDKIFFIFKAHNLKGELLRDFEGGKNVWIKEKDLKNQENLFDDVLEVVKLVNEEELIFMEKKYKVDSF